MHSRDSATAFYAVANSNHFLGLVALVNSLRLVGHRERIYVTDCGLAEKERLRLRDHVTLVDAPHRDAPHLVKTIAPLAHPSEVMILVDADIIVTRPLDELIARARAGKIVAVVDRAAGRYDERWSELLDLGPLRRQPYANSGLVVVDRALGMPLLRQIAAGCLRVDTSRAYGADGWSDYPFRYLDQDVFNAVLATYDEDTFDLLDYELAPTPPFRGLRLLDEGGLRCRYDGGREPFALHHVLDKPWLATTRWSIYSRLLARLLLGEDVAFPVARDELPVRLRPGAMGWTAKRWSHLVAVGGGMRGRLGVRRALTRRRRRGPTASAAPTESAVPGDPPSHYAPPSYAELGE